MRLNHYSWQIKQCYFPYAVAPKHSSILKPLLTMFRVLSFRQISSNTSIKLYQTASWDSHMNSKLLWYVSQWSSGHYPLNGIQNITFSYKQNMPALYGDTWIISEKEFPAKRQKWSAFVWPWLSLSWSIFYSIQMTVKALFPWQLQLDGKCPVKNITQRVFHCLHF